MSAWLATVALLAMSGLMAVEAMHEWKKAESRRQLWSCLIYAIAATTWFHFARLMGER